MQPDRFSADGVRVLAPRRSGELEDIRAADRATESGAGRIVCLATVTTEDGERSGEGRNRVVSGPDAGDHDVEHRADPIGIGRIFVGEEDPEDQSEDAREVNVGPDLSGRLCALEQD